MEDTGVFAQTTCSAKANACIHSTGRGSLALLQGNALLRN